MSLTKRAYKKWNINELIRLQREYELLELSIQEISKLHERSEKAILCRLEQERFINNWSEARGFNEYAILQPELYDYIIHLQNVYNTNNKNNEVFDKKDNETVVDEVKNEITRHVNDEKNNKLNIQNILKNMFSFF
jgi:SLT domain-containing protein